MTLDQIVRARLYVVISAFVVLTLIGGCAPAAASTPAGAPTAAPAVKIKRGGTLRLLQDKDISSLDPHLAVTGGVYHTSLLYDGLLAFKFNEKTQGFDMAPELTPNGNSRTRPLWCSSYAKA